MIFIATTLAALLISEPAIRWDLNSDQVVDGADLGVLLGAWGDTYDAADLGALLGAWGTAYGRHDTGSGQWLAGQGSWGPSPWPDHARLTFATDQRIDQLKPIGHHDNG